MLEMGARFTEDLYVKVSIDPDFDDCSVTLIKNRGAETTTKAGNVDWDD